jgi:hypothetical protein
LRRSVIDFEYANSEIGIGISQRERVKTRTKYHDLTHTDRDAICHRILRKPAARGYEQAHWPERFVGRHFAEGGPCLLIQNSRREWVSENCSAF